MPPTHAPAPRTFAWLIVGVAALAAGGKDNGEPGLRPQYHPNYYGAYALDPDGHNIEAVCHEAPVAAASA